MTESSSSGAVHKFFGLLIIAASALWMLFCGLCGFWTFYAMVTEAPLNLEMMAGALFILAISGGGAAAGYALLTVGRSLAK